MKQRATIPNPMEFLLVIECYRSSSPSFDKSNGFTAHANKKKNRSNGFTAYKSNGFTAYHHVKTAFSTHLKTPFCRWRCVGHVVRQGPTWPVFSIEVLGEPMVGTVLMGLVNHRKTNIVTYTMNLNH